MPMISVIMSYYASWKAFNKNILVGKISTDYQISRCQGTLENHLKPMRQMPELDSWELRPLPAQVSTRGNGMLLKTYHVDQS